MVKSVLGVKHQGLRDWVVQRLSAIFMALFSIFLFLYVVCHPNLSFAEWHSLFANPWMKVMTILFILSLLSHAWVGIWTVFTDYITCYVIRATLNTLVLFMLAACFFWGLQILWSL